MNNVKISREDKQFFYGDYPVVAQSLPLKTSVKLGNIVGSDVNGNYGLYDGTTYSEPYAIATQDVTYTDTEVNCECILGAYLVKEAVIFPEGDDTSKRKVEQMLKKQGIYLR